MKEVEDMRNEKCPLTLFGEAALWLKVLVVLQLLLIMGLIISALVRPQVAQTIPGELLQSTGALPVTAAQEGGVQVYPQETVDRCAVLTYPIPLPSGAYDISIQYESISHPEAPSYNMYDCAGWVDLALPSNSHALKANPIYLSDDNTVVQGQFWLRMGAGAEDLTLEINHYGTGSLTIQQVEVRECVVYRATRILGFLAIFLIIDLAWLLFSHNSPFQLAQTHRIILLGLISIAVFSSILYFSDCLYINGRGVDLIFHLNRIESLAEALKDGQIPQRVQTEMLNGYGYISPLFYGELFLVIPALLRVLSVPVLTVYQIFIFFINLATAAITYWCLDRIVRSPWKSLVGATIYTLSTYRLLKNLLWRNALGELIAMSFLPLILYGFYLIYTAEDEDAFSITSLFPLILGFTGIIQSHLLTCEIVALFAIPFALVFWKKTFQPKRFLALAKAALLTFFLNAWFLIPLLQSMLKMDLVITSRNVNNLSAATLYLHQLLALFPVPFRLVESTLHDQMVLAPGPAFVIGTFCFFVYSLCKARVSSPKKSFSAISVFFALACISLFMTTYWVPWDTLARVCPSLVRVLGMIQFPWRYLSLSVAFLTFGIVLFLDLLDHQFFKKASMILMAVMVGSSVFATSCFYTVAAELLSTSYCYTLDAQDRMDVVQGEYLPSGTDLTGLEDRTVISGESVMAKDFSRDGVHSQVWCSNSSSSDSYLDLPILAYENYHASLEDGSYTPISTGENGRIRVQIPAGYQGLVFLSYQEPILWRFCEGISLVCLAILFILALKERKTSSQTLCSLGAKIHSPERG